MARTGACTKLKEIHINSQFTIANLTMSTFWSMYKAENKDVYLANFVFNKIITECDS